MSHVKSICFLALASFFVTGANANSSLWSHNGSVVRLDSTDKLRRFIYTEPRRGLPAASGDLLFEGVRQGDNYVGTAYLFSKACGPLGYQVRGFVGANQTYISLQGSAPRRDSQCRVTSHFNDKLIFKYIAMEIPSATPSYPTQRSEAAPQSAQRDSGSGTGFLVSADGNVVTNAHVVRQCESMSVTKNGRAPISARLIAKDENNDLALIKVALEGESFGKLRPNIRLGEAVAAFGFPLSSVLAASGNFTLGNVTALAGVADDTRYLQVSVPVQPGNSGGPLMDQNGNLVGVISSKLNAIKVAVAIGDIPQNVNFAIKASLVANFLDNNHVAYETGTASSPIQSADLADRIRAISVFIVCQN